MSSDDLSIASTDNQLEKSTTKLSTSPDHAKFDDNTTETVTVYDLVSELQESLQKLDNELDEKNHSFQNSIQKIESKLVQLGQPKTT